MSGKNEQAVATLLQDSLADVEIPESLQASLERHRQNLVSLVATLRTAGLTESEIEANVSTVVDSYKQELLRAIKAMVR